MVTNEEVKEREYQPIQVRRDKLRELNNRNSIAFKEETDVYRRIRLKEKYLTGKLLYLEAFTQCARKGLNWYKGEIKAEIAIDKPILH